MVIRAGALDQEVVVLAPTITTDAVGDEKEEWVALATVWAAKREVGATEILRNPEIRGVVTAVFTIRHPDVALDSRMRVQGQDGRLYEITGLTELPGRRVGFEIMARSLDKLGATGP